jgi:hypothetical protein
MFLSGICLQFSIASPVPKICMQLSQYQVGGGGVGRVVLEISKLAHCIFMREDSYRERTQMPARCHTPRKQHCKSVKSGRRYHIQVFLWQYSIRGAKIFENAYVLHTLPTINSITHF